MRCKKCGRMLGEHDTVCRMCGTPTGKKRMTHAEAEAVAARARTAQKANVQRNVHVKRVAAGEHGSAPQPQKAQDIVLIEKDRRKGDVLYGVLVTVLVLFALVSLSLCILLLTRGADAKNWFDCPESSAVPTREAVLPTPVAPADQPTVPPTTDPTGTSVPGAGVMPTPVPTSVPTMAPTSTPTAKPTPAPTPAPTSAAEAKAAIETMLLEGIERNYTKEELEPLSQYELSMLRNGLYAYSGLSFRKSQYKDFFEDFDWYDPDTSDDEKVYERFNSHQLKNVATIIKVEKEKGYR